MKWNYFKNLLTYISNLKSFEGNEFSFQIFFLGFGQILRKQRKETRTIPTDRYFFLILLMMPFLKTCIYLNGLVIPQFVTETLEISTEKYSEAVQQDHRVI